MSVASAASPERLGVEVAPIMSLYLLQRLTQASGPRSPSAIMSAEVFNPNPTIFAPAKAKKTAHAYARANSIWLEDGERTDEDDFDQSDEPEAIDQDEIFGMSTDTPRVQHIQ